MGYTQRWYQQEIPPDRWALIAADARKIVAAAKQNGIILLHEYDEPGTEPAIDDEHIWLNGDGADGHETLAFMRKQDPGRNGDGFTFCKTAQKPYDAVVCAILARAKHHAPEQIRVASDGDEDDWEEALAWATEVLGEPVTYPCDS